MLDNQIVYKGPSGEEEGKGTHSVANPVASGKGKGKRRVTKHSTPELV